MDPARSVLARLYTLVKQREQLADRLAELEAPPPRKQPNQPSIEVKKPAVEPVVVEPKKAK